MKSKRVPHTPANKLAKMPRENEELMQNLPGTRMKIKEKSEIKLQSILTKTNPRAGYDCMRPDCVMCQTNMEADEGNGQNSHTRSLVYETWCGTCQERDAKKAVEEGRH